MSRTTPRLGRVRSGDRHASLAFSTRRRRRWRGPLVALALVFGVGYAVQAGPSTEPPSSGSTTERGHTSAREPAAAPPPRTADDEVTEEVAPATSTPPLARLGDLDLHLPSPSPVVVGFHEAATVTALATTPVGSLTEDRNTTRTDLQPDVPDGSAYLVLSSRGRAAGPTSAIDVVLEPDDPVLAPVTGRVLDVRNYLLYGAHQDLRIEIAPDGQPDVRLVMIHLDGAEVRIGDQVIGGVTRVAGSARTFPFSSHIDRETEPDRFPHVHIELQPIDAPRPGDDEDDEDHEAGENDAEADTPLEQASGN